MWFLITGILLVIPFMMSFMGKGLARTNASDRNEHVYYRTERSMKNRETRKYSQKVCGRFYTWVGRRTLIITVVMAAAFVFIPVTYYETACGLWLMTEMILLLSAVPVTEEALKRKFFATPQYR